MSREIPKVAFLFLVFAIISGGYVQTVLSNASVGPNIYFNFYFNYDGWSKYDFSMI